MAKEGKVKKSIFKRWWFWVVVAIVIIGIAAGSSGGGSDKTQPASTTPKTSTQQDTPSKTNASKQSTPKKTAPKKVEKTYGVGDSVSIDNVTFKVNKVDSKTEIKSNNEFVDPAKASGKFIILDVSIKNGQKDALTMDSSYFKLKTKDDTTYESSTDGNVLMVIPEKKQLFLEQLNPGIEKSGTIVFDVPKDLKLSDVYLNCATGFWGTKDVKINLSK